MEAKEKKLRELYSAFAAIKNRDEAAAFLRDICTLAEINSMAERWQVAQLLAMKIPYRKIREITGASTTTVTRVAKWFKEGTGGYKKILSRVKK